MATSVASSKSLWKKCEYFTEVFWIRSNIVDDKMLGIDTCMYVGCEADAVSVNGGSLLEDGEESPNIMYVWDQAT